jgi:hypothetical protein
VRSSNWELNNPAPGDVLTAVGIRISGTVVQPPADREGVSAREQVLDHDSDSPEYVVTGSMVSARDYKFDMGSAPQHGGTDVVLSVNGELMQAQVPGPASDIGTGSTLTVAGEVSLIADYEWDAFELVDTRRSWVIEEVHHIEIGDYLLQLRPAR